MSYNVPASFQVKYNNNVKLRVQQMGNPLASAVEWQYDKSAEKVKIKDLVGHTEAKEATDRHGRTEWGNRTYDGVWIPKPNELYDGDLIDNADQLATAISLTGTATMGAAATINRAKIRRILEGFYAPIISGKEGTTITAFPGGNIIPVTAGGASGPQKMNTKKLREANKFLSAGHAGEAGERFTVLTADDNDALLTEVPATSSDFKAAYGGVVEDGKLIKLLGWNFIHLELDNQLLTTIPDLSTDSSGYRKTPFWVKPGLRVNEWEGLRSEVGKIPELRFSMGYLAGTTLAASRTEPEMSGIILNEKG
ncbi:MAG: hypothetical protein B7Y88_13860 [Sphingomonadales bacterium 32-64-17]|nr:MAG: hypothetical protein B7Y88_13860 [Sphingomonadales bacterium 32-64-17]